MQDEALFLLCMLWKPFHGTALQGQEALNGRRGVFSDEHPGLQSMDWVAGHGIYDDALDYGESFNMEPP